MLKEFADDSFTFDGNERKLSKRVENTVAKGEAVYKLSQFLYDNAYDTQAIAILWVFSKISCDKNAGNHHFLISLQGFQKVVFMWLLKLGVVQQRVNSKVFWVSFNNISICTP